MIKSKKDKLIKLFSEQLQIIKDIQLNLDCDLYVCFEGEEEIPKLENKIVELQKIKEQLIKLFASLITEF